MSSLKCYHKRTRLTKMHISYLTAILYLGKVTVVISLSIQSYPVCKVTLHKERLAKAPFSIRGIKLLRDLSCIFSSHFIIASFHAIDTIWPARTQVASMCARFQVKPQSKMSDNKEIISSN